MAMISASLNSEVEQIKKIMPGWHTIACRRTPLSAREFRLRPIFKSVRKASLNQIRKVLLGQISSWSELGGKDQPIRVVLVAAGGGVTTVANRSCSTANCPTGRTSST